MAAETINAKLDGNGELVAVIFGVTGLVGKELAKALLSTGGWKVYGVARRPDNVSPITDTNFQFISCDLLDRSSANRNLSPVRHVTHLFWVTWAAQLRFDTSDCSDQNRTMLANVLDVILPAAPALRHVSLQTGIKHYVSLTGAAVGGGGGRMAVYCEDSPRAESGNNFYYALEDLLRERLSGGGRRVAWSVLRPGLILGCSNRTFFNFMGSLCVYGAICKKLKKPFVFGGSAACWEGFCINGSDARLVAEQHVWAATNEINTTADGEAFNVCNGWSFTWKEIWGAVAEKFGVAAAAEDEEGMFSPEFHYMAAMTEKGRVWAEIVEEEGLIPTEMEELANWGFLDSLFRLPGKMVASRNKSDRLGFSVKYKMLDSILYWIDVMRYDKLIPFP
ncbi:3-oxo-Delta(4,5)-steroid 5-beta-reductase, partial [Cucurbita argyrosperma subsp. argyrosperma]